MTDWTIVLWSDARQIAQQAGLDKDLWPSGSVTPKTFFETLRKVGQLSDSARFIAGALPRFEAISWVAKILPQPDESHADYRERRGLRDIAQRWIGDPDDENRRAVFDIAENSNKEWPETLLGLAIFFSGGSITPPDLDPVLPQPHITALLVAGALEAAAVEDPKSYDELMNKALDLANIVAINGRESLHAK